MRDFLHRTWWMFAWRGAVALLFGVVAILWPGLTLLWLVALFAAYALVGGGAAIVGAVKNRLSDRGWWLVLVLGLTSVAAGTIAIFFPGLTALALVLVMGANALVTGVLEIVVAYRLRKIVQHEWLLILSGVAGIVFGVLVFLFPGAGALAMVWLISLYAILTGVLLLALAWRARTWGANRASVGDFETVARQS